MNSGAMGGKRSKTGGGAPRRTPPGKMTVTPYRLKTVVLPLLQTLCSLTSGQRTILLAHVDDKTLATLCDTIRKVLSARLPKLMKSRLKSKLGRHQVCLRRLSDECRLADKYKRKHLPRMGGSPLGLILKVAIPIILSGLSSLVQKKKR